LTNLALLPAEGRKQNKRQKRQKAENIDKPCPAPCRRYRIRDTKQRILTNLALLHTGVLVKAESRVRDKGDRKQKILTNLALLPAEVLQMANSNKSAPLSVTEVKHRSHLHTLNAVNIKNFYFTPK
jgi:hypothetical protein